MFVCRLHKPMQRLYTSDDDDDADANDAGGLAPMADSEDHNSVSESLTAALMSQKQHPAVLTTAGPAVASSASASGDGDQQHLQAADAEHALPPSVAAATSTAVLKVQTGGLASQPNAVATKAAPAATVKPVEDTDCELMDERPGK